MGYVKVAQSTDKIPALLSDRYNQFLLLDDTYKIFNSMRKAGPEYEFEKVFLQKRIDEMEAEIRKTNDETLLIIRKIFQDDLEAKLYAGLHFFCGYTYQQIEKIFPGVSEQAIKAKIYRAFEKTAERSC